MGALENTLKMLFKLRNGGVIKRQELAEYLGVSEKQIARYKKELDSMFTIETIPGPLGGYKLVDSYFPFKELLSDKEIELLKYYSKSLQYINNKEIEKALDKMNYSILNSKKEKHVSKMKTCFFILINYFNRRDESILFF